MYYSKQFQNKPKGYEVAEVQKGLSQTEITIEQLADDLSQGATFKPALLNGTHSSDWISQQLFALDFDHDTTIQEQIAKCSQLNIYPCFGYTSFSHTEQEHHFRLVFCTDTVITDVETRNKLQNTLISIFDKSDNVTKDCTRIFFGGKTLICNDFDRRINGYQIIDKFYKEPTLPITAKSIDTKSCKKKLNVYSNNQSNNDMALKVEAIKSLNVGVMRCLLGKALEVSTNKEGNISSSISVPFQYDLTFKCEKDIYSYINSIDLSEYLGIYGYVKCILPEHDDHEPSAHIYKTNDGTQVYKCFGCNKARTIIGITEELAGCKRSEAIEFIKSVYGIKLVESDWTVKQKKLMIDSANYLDTEDFKISNPELAKLIRTRKTDIQAILIHFTQYVNEDMQIDGKPFFFASYKTLMKVCGIREDNRKKLASTLVLFSLLNMVIKLQVTDIPEKELNEAKHIAALYHQKKLTGFYSFEEYGINSLKDSENIAKTLKANNITLKGLGREYILRTFGVDLANKCYPQYRFENSQGTSKKSDERTSQIVECLFYCIEQKGYATEKDVVYLLGDKYKYQTTEIQIKKSLQEILVSYDLKRIRANKDTKQLYHVECNGYPFIIIKI